MTEYCYCCRLQDPYTQKCSGLKRPAEEMRRKCPYCLADSAGWVSVKDAIPKSRYQVIVFTSDLEQLMGFAIEDAMGRVEWGLPYGCGEAQAWRPLPNYPTFERDEE